MIASTSTKTKKELEAISEKAKGTRLNLKDLVIPLSLTLVLILVSIFVFVPMIKSASDSQKALKETKAKEQQLTTLKSSLKKIDEDVLQQDLTNAKAVIPKTLKVSSFIYFIDQLAREKNLAAETISAGDVNVSGSGETKSNYKGVSGPLAYSGTLENVMSFLDALYTSSPYIVTANNINLSGSTNQDKWNVELSLTGYYVEDTGETRVDIYLPFKAYTDFNDVITTFSEKAKKLAK